MRFIVFLFVLLIPLQVFAYNKTEIDSLVEKYESYHSVILNKSVEITINNINGKLYFEEKNCIERLYTSNLAGKFTEASIQISGFNEISDISACTYTFQKEKYRKNCVKEFNTRKMFSDDNFHDDTKEIYFSYPGITKGVISKLEYTEVYEHSWNLSTFTFQDYVPIQNSSFSLICDNDIFIDFNEYNLDSFKVNYSETSLKSSKKYLWYINNVEPYKYFTNSRGRLHYIPHIIPRVSYYLYKEDTIYQFKDLNYLFKWYVSLIDSTDFSADESMKELLKEIVNEDDTDLEKVEKVYNWIQKNIKYIAVEYLFGGFIPRDPKLVFHRKYGDCKDMAALLKSMLDDVGVTTYLTWAGTRDRPYKYNTEPTPWVDNHMLITYPINDTSFMFIDPTNRYLPYNIISSFIQGKEALFILPDNTPKVATIPFLSSEQNTHTDSIVLEIEDNNIVGEGTIVFHGYFYNHIKSGMDANNRDLKKYLTSKLEKGNNKFMLDEYKIKETSYPTIITYKFHVPDYVYRSDDEIFINLNIGKVKGLDVYNHDRTRDIEFESKSKFHEFYKLKIPEGYKVSYLPKDFSYNTADYKININYKIEDGYIEYEYLLVINKALLKNNELKEWNDFIEMNRKAVKEVIILKQE